MWIDAIILAIFLFFLWRGYEKGFLKNFLYLIGWIVSLVEAVRERYISISPLQFDLTARKRLSELEGWKFQYHK